MKHSLITTEALRRRTATWLLNNDLSLICCAGNELGRSFAESYTLPPLKEELIETIVDKNEQITLVFQSRIFLPAHKSVSGKSVSFVILRYVRALYDDYGNIYSYLTLGYSCT